MDRKDKIERAAQPDGQVRQIKIVGIETVHFDPRFGYIERLAERGETGLLRFLTFCSPHPDEPKFEVRVDDGAPGRRKSQPEIDFDIHNVSPQARADFKACKGGYSGHHTIKASTDQIHAYDVSLSLPGRLIFKGTIKVAFTSLSGVSEVANAQDTTDAEVIRGQSDADLPPR